MTTTNLDFWPDDIHVDVLSPVTILRMQEGLLEKKTHGILQAKLSTTATDKLVQHDLDLIAPYLNFYRVRVLAATHSRELIYPVTVTAECFIPKPRPQKLSELLPSGPLLFGVPPPNQRVAASQDQFIDLVREVLRSSDVRALIESLIARSNEVTGTQSPTASDAAGNGSSTEGEPPDS